MKRVLILCTGNSCRSQMAEGWVNHELGEAWDTFAAKTSVLPFGAILAGQQQLRLGELGARKIAIALLLWAGSLYTHRWLTGVSPAPLF